MAIIKGRIKAISISTRRGTKKTNVGQAELKAGFGVVGDVHAGSALRQVSLLGAESIEKTSEAGIRLSPGDFAENITTEGIALEELRVGTKLSLGATAEIEITQIGKTCHGRCEIFNQLGDCIMPREGLFAKVTKSGKIKTGDVIRIIGDEGSHTDNQ